MKPRIRKRIGSFFRGFGREKNVRENIGFSPSFPKSFVRVKKGRLLATLAVERSLNGLGFKPKERALRSRLKSLMHDYVELYLTTPITGKHADKLLREMAETDSRVSNLISSTKGNEAAKKFAALLLKNTTWVKGPGPKAKE